MKTQLVLHSMRTYVNEGDPFHPVLIPDGQDIYLVVQNGKVTHTICMQLDWDWGKERTVKWKCSGEYEVYGLPHPYPNRPPADASFVDIFHDESHEDYVAWCADETDPEDPVELLGAFPSLEDALKIFPDDVREAPLIRTPVQGHKTEEEYLSYMSKFWEAWY